ncbi:MAG: hypothetical protein H7Y09_15610 [Chitinophagaceae bacterium]|nr:hypothetical protein [Anaerolineae bacterium]
MSSKNTFSYATIMPMTIIFKPILLDQTWCYFYSSNTKADYSAADLDASPWIPLPYLSDWTMSSSVQSGADWFRREFNLEPTEGCINYLLQIDNAPESTVIYVNGKLVGTIEAHKSFADDVTDAVALGTNIISMKLTAQTNTGGGAFGQIRLQVFPCPDETQYPLPKNIL